MEDVISSNVLKDNNEVRSLTKSRSGLVQKFVFGL